VREDAVNGQAQEFAIHALKGLCLAGKANEFGGANRGEVRGMREKDQPFTFLVSKAAGAVRGVGMEIRCCFMDSGKGHDWTPFKVFRLECLGLENIWFIAELAFRAVQLVNRIQCSLYCNPSVQ